MTTPREIAAVAEACPSDACRYPECRCALPIAVRAGLAGAAAWDRLQARREGAIRALAAAVDRRARA